MTDSPYNYYCHSEHCRKYIQEHEFMTHKRIGHDVEIQDKDYFEKVEKDSNERREP